MGCGLEIPEIKFGTDGWRGLIAADFTYDNAALVATAVLEHLRRQGRDSRPLLIGYDRRFSAEHYAAHLATHLAGLGADVRLAAEACPTPAVAYGVTVLQASCAIMLTASHNPFYWQGFKFIPYFAGPAMPEDTDAITAIIRELAPGFKPPPVSFSFDGPTYDPRDDYFAQLDRVLDNSALAAANLRVLYSAMHGVGAGWLDDYLRRNGVAVESVACQRDVYFGGRLPDPSPGNLRELIPEARLKGSSLIIGTDGDADRFGLMNLEGQYFSANEVLPLLAEYLLAQKPGRGALARTVATSHLLDSVAAAHGLTLVETKVGFKYIGAELRAGALIGGEESGGVSFQGHIPEKDGILSSLLALEMCARRGMTLTQLHADLLERMGPRAYTRVDQHLPEEKKLRLLAALRAYAAPQFAGREIADKVTLDGVKFIFTDGSWVMGRASGTEPVVRIYMEAVAPQDIDEFSGAMLAQMAALAET